MGRRPDRAPTIVMLHEGLGCVALWRDFRRGSQLRPAAACSSIAAGYGGTAVDLPLPLEYMRRRPGSASRGPRRVRPRARRPRRAQRRRLDRGVYAGGHAAERRRARPVAPQMFPRRCFASIAEAGDAYVTGDLRAKLADTTRSHCAFRGWNDAWLDPGFKAWKRGCGQPLARSRARHPGRRRSIWDPQTSPRHRGPLANARSEPHPRRLSPPFAAVRSARGDARGDRPVLRDPKRQ